VINRAGFRKNGYFWVFPEIFRSEIAAGFDWRSLAAALVERDILIPEADGKIQRVVRRIEDGKPIRMFCFTPAVLGAEEPSENQTKEAHCSEG
jgi:putative DNA primase/helicase